jgi:hypothetical protein
MNILSNINSRKPARRAGFVKHLLAPALLAGLVLAGCGDDDTAATRQKAGESAAPPVKASAGIGERIRFKPKPERKKKNANRSFTFCDEETARDVTFDFDKLVYGHTPQNVVSKRKDGTEERLEMTESKLPKGFPEEFPIYPGARIINGGKSVKADGLAFMLNLATQDDFFAVSSFYRSTLPGKGFSVGADRSPCNEKIMRVMAEKGKNMSLSIAIYQDGSGTYILANIMMKKPAPPPAEASKEEPVSGS